MLAAHALRAVELQRREAPRTIRAVKRNLASAIDRVASALGNTKAVCRKCYVHPAVIDSYLDGTLLQLLATSAAASELPVSEAVVLSLLQTRLERGDLSARLESSLHSTAG